ncbi:hypothetical protein [Myroides sp. N17-2]|uniref:hypothetical protein n=1 Tax=Myroides sp. N17-2 TaxID=2030799 RepID=UPI000EFAB0C3|nr:hypothetical protein [Myroides sp. N17-2]
MDSKQLFRIYNKQFHSANWFNKAGVIAQSDGDVEWVYCGVNDDFKYEKVVELISDFFKEEENLYLCCSSTKSLLVSKEEAVSEISTSLHKKEVGLINESLDRIIHFTMYGVYKVGIITEFPKSRERTPNTLLQVAFYANIVDEQTKHIPRVIDLYLKEIALVLNRDYGGVMEHLWININLSEVEKVFPFRFQKRVESSSSYINPYSYNVGHYSIAPDFNELKNFKTEEAICKYFFNLLYTSMKVLHKKQKSLGGFNAIIFKEDFRKACKNIGYTID